MTAESIPEAEAISARGDECLEAGRFEEALACYRKAGSADPAEAAYRYNAGNALRHLARFEEAIAEYGAALELQPGLSVAHFNRALCLLQLGDLQQGFREYEWRKVCPTFVEPRYGMERPWRGEDLSGKSLFIYPELYQGDLIQFGRYALLALQAGAARVQLAAPEAMHRLLRTLSPSLELLAEDAWPADYDYQCALMSLPAAFGTTLATVPRAGHYLRAEPELVAKWQARIGASGLRIGVVWQGSVRAADRSFPLAALAGIAKIPGVRLISLQKHAGLEQLASLPPGMTVETLEGLDDGPDLFVETAAAMRCCQGVISADTSTVHLAGALGVTTWLALDTPSDWRWLTERIDTPWYPSVRLFRQPVRGAWDGVFRDMEAALRAAATGG